MSDKDLEVRGYYGAAAASMKVQYVGIRSGEIGFEDIEKLVSRYKKRN